MIDWMIRSYFWQENKLLSLLMHSGPHPPTTKCRVDVFYMVEVTAG